MFSIYMLGTVNSKSFVGKDFLQNKWKYELTVNFNHKMIAKRFTESSNKVELRINLARAVVHNHQSISDSAELLN